MRVAIYGAGAMGTVLGAFLSKGGVQAQLVTRNAGHVKALRERGAEISGRANFTQRVTALTPEEMSGVYDVIFLMTKQRDNISACSFLLNYLAADGVVCTMQNGLPERTVAEAVGEKRCMGCALSWGATFMGCGKCALTSDPKKMTFALGACGVPPYRAEEVFKLLSLAGKVKFEKNFIGARWAKLSINSAFSPLSAITGLTFGEIAKDKLGKRLALALLNEAFAAAKQNGVKLQKIQGHDIVKIFKCRGGVKKAFALAVMPLAMKSHKDIRSGMYYDLKSGKKCDIDYLNGVILNAGVDAPLNKRTVETVRAVERGERAIGYDNLKYLYGLTK